MVKYAMLFTILLGINRVGAQELYIFTDPASNVPAHSLALRLNNMLMPMADVGEGKVNRNSFRFSPELVYGISKNLMVKLSGYGSNMFQDGFRAEGASLYTKYRFYSIDDFHKHFRMAAFAKGAIQRNPYEMESTVTHLLPDGAGGTYEHSRLMKHSADEQMLEGNHSGWQVGVVATQLVHKLAVSGTASILGRTNNPGGYNRVAGDAGSALQGAVSAGYLLFPRSYESYGQTNVNLYLEFIGQSSLAKPGFFVDAAPAVQIILNSVARIDMAYRFQMGGNMSRFNQEQWLLRFEYNWLQAFK